MRQNDGVLFFSFDLADGYMVVTHDHMAVAFFGASPFFHALAFGTRIGRLVWTGAIFGVWNSVGRGSCNIELQ